MNIALVGARGFVGTELQHALREHRVTCVDRSNYNAAQSESYDVVINSAMPSGRFWAKNNPSADFEETVRKTHRLLHDWNWARFVQISSVSARAQLDTIYGRHKAAAEALCDVNSCLIVRLGPMYGPTLAKGVLIDLLQDRQVFVSGESRYAFAPLDWVCRKIAKSMDQTGLREFGAANGIRLLDVREAIKSKSQFKGPVDIQEFDDVPDDAPPVEDVLEFLLNRKQQSDGRLR